MEPNDQAVSSFHQVRYDGSLCLCDQGGYSTSIGILQALRRTRRSMQHICLLDERFFASQALNAKNRRHERRCGAIFAIVCLQQVYSVLQRDLNKVQEGESKEEYLPLGFLLGELLIFEVDSVYYVWRGSALSDYNALG